MVTAGIAVSTLRRVVSMESVNARSSFTCEVRRLDDSDDDLPRFQPNLHCVRSRRKGLLSAEIGWRFFG